MYFKLNIAADCRTGSLFRKPGSSTRQEYKSEYMHLVCGECGKLNEAHALTIAPLYVKIRDKYDLIASDDDFYIVSRRLKDCLDGCAPAQIDFIQVNSRQDHFVMMPIKQLSPDAKSGQFNVNGFCEACKRYRSAVWGSSKLVVASECDIVCYRLESWWGMMPALIVSERIANVIIGTGFTNIALSKIFV